MLKRTGIELLPHACRIVEVASPARLFGGGTSDSPRVRAFREIPCSPSDPGALTVALREALKGLERRASVAVWGLRSTHHVLQLPPAVPADLEAIARRESRTATGGLPPAPHADAVVAGPLRDGWRQTGYVAVSAEELRTRLQPLVEAGVGVDAVTTPGLAHASLVAQRRAMLPDAVVAVLSVNAQATAITVVHGPVVLFARELPWGGQSDSREGELGGAGRAAFAARIAAELRRSLVYVRQSQKVDVSSVLVCGDLFELRSLTGPIVNELGLEVETLDVGDDLDLSKLPEPSDNFRSRLGAWRTAIALAAEPEPRRSLRSQDARPAAASPELAGRAIAGAVAGALIVAAAWGVFGYLAAGVTAREARLRRTVGVLEPEWQRQEDERRRVAEAAARAAALEAFASQGPRLARVLESFSLAAPPDVVLTAVRVQPGVASWRVAVEGQAEGADAAAAHAALNAFLKALDASPLLGRPSSPPSLQARTSDPPEIVEPTPAEAVPDEIMRPVQAVTAPRPSAAGPAYIEVARDGRLYRIPIRRNTGNLEAARKAEEARRLQDAGAARRAAATSPPAGAAGGPGRHPASVVEFTLRYEVPK
jgi:hypothetical protein